MALPKLIVVLGTTACGKSGLGVELAKRFGGEIVSADSRQVYRGLDLGTGKVTEEEMEGVPHHMLDVVEPNQPYSVAEFQAGAYAAIDGILSRGNTPFLVGGTGLYVRAVTEGFTFTDARPDPALRAKLEGKTTAELYALLREKTGVTLTDGEEFNRQRLMRSVEKALSGQWESPPPRPRYDCLLLGVTFPRTWCAAALMSGSRHAWTPEWWRRWPPSAPAGPTTPFWRGWDWSTAISSGTSRGKSPPWTR